MDDISEFGPTDLVAQQQAMELRKARILEEVRQSAQRAGVFKPYEPDLREVGGFTLSTGQRMPGRIVPATWGTALQAITPLVAQYTAGQREQQFNREDAQFQARVREDAIRRLAQMPQGTPAVTPLTPNDDEGNPMPSFPATEPSLRDRLMYAASLSSSPSLAGVAQKYIEDQLVNAPTREEQKRWERMKFDAQQTHQQKMENRPISVPGIGLMDPVTRTVIQGTAPPPSYQFSSDMGTRANPKTGAVEPTGHTPAPKPYDSGTRDKLTQAGGQVASFQNLVSTFKPEYSGSVGAVLRSNEKYPLGKLTNDPGTAWWSDFRTLSGQIRHGLYGASLTPAEKAAFESTSIDSSTNSDYVTQHLGKLLTISQAAAARTQALADGGRMDPMTGAVILNGQEVPGTRSTLQDTPKRPNPSASGPVTDAPGSNGIPMPTTQAEFDALPKGAAFRKPGDTKTYVKR